MPLRRFTTFLVLVFAVSCEDSIQPPLPERIALTLVDVAVREVYLHVAVSNPAGNEALILKRDGATVATFAAIADTIIADTGLARATAYGYSAILVTGNEAGARSNPVSARTLAPASRDFTWQTFLFGEAYSALYDVAVVNDTLVYAVGEIYLRDSLGNLDPEAYNLLKWDGARWDVMRVPITLCPGTAYVPLRAIFAFAADDIWITAGGGMIHWDGRAFRFDCSVNALLLGGLRRIWGIGSAVYAVGGGGTIICSQDRGARWERIESGTTTDIVDAWGVVNPVTRSTEVYCAVSSFFVPGDRRILRITSNTAVDSIPWGPQRRIWSVWTRGGFPIYAAGGGVFENSRHLWRQAPLPPIGTNIVRGQSPADIIVAGDFGLAAHFNGEDWHVFGDIYNAGYVGIAMKGDFVALVGDRSFAQGVVTLGRR